MILQQLNFALWGCTQVDYFKEHVPNSKKGFWCTVNFETMHEIFLLEAFFFSLMKMKCVCLWHKLPSGCYTNTWLNIFLPWNSCFFYSVISCSVKLRSKLAWHWIGISLSVTVAGCWVLYTLGRFVKKKVNAASVIQLSWEMEDIFE